MNYIHPTTHLEAFCVDTIAVRVNPKAALAAVTSDLRMAHTIWLKEGLEWSRVDGRFGSIKC